MFQNGDEPHLSTMKKMQYIIFSFILISAIYSQSTILEEAGYILAMEATFAAMSLASTQDDYYGYYAVGGFDSFMAYSGVMQALARYEEVPEYNVFGCNRISPKSNLQFSVCKN